MRPKFWIPPFLFGREPRIQKLIISFSSHVVEAVEWLHRAGVAFTKCDRKSIEDAIKRISEAEGKADNIRREIEKELFEGRFFDRAEKIDMIENIDNVADFAEMAGYTMLYHIPPKMTRHISEQLLKMIEGCLLIAKQLSKALNLLYTDFSKVPPVVNAIEHTRDVVRRTSDQFMKEIFAANISPKTLVLLRYLGYRIVRIADAAEEAGDRIRFLAVKYA
jgi:predicted phosphate transport protein (TIGR00153 family)